MKTNRLDSITDLLKERVGSIVGEAHKQFKGTNPYRQEKIPDEERLRRFYEMTPEKFDFARQNFGDEAVEGYVESINELIRRKQ